MPRATATPRSTVLRRPIFVFIKSLGQVTKTSQTVIKQETAGAPDKIGELGMELPVITAIPVISGARGLTVKKQEEFFMFSVSIFNRPFILPPCARSPGAQAGNNGGGCQGIVGYRGRGRKKAPNSAKLVPRSGQPQGKYTRCTQKKKVKIASNACDHGQCPFAGFPPLNPAMNDTFFSEKFPYQCGGGITESPGHYGHNYYIMPPGPKQTPKKIDQGGKGYLHVKQLFAQLAALFYPVYKKFLVE